MQRYQRYGRGEDQRDQLDQKEGLFHRVDLIADISPKHGGEHPDDAARAVDDADLGGGKPVLLEIIVRKAADRACKPIYSMQQRKVDSEFYDR